MQLPTEPQLLCELYIFADTSAVVAYHYMQSQPSKLTMLSSRTIWLDDGGQSMYVLQSGCCHVEQVRQKKLSPGGKQGVAVPGANTT